MAALKVLHFLQQSHVKPDAEIGRTLLTVGAGFKLEYC
jgi:hypothetical protein